MRPRKITFFIFVFGALLTGTFFYFREKTVGKSIYTRSPYLQEWVEKWLLEDSCGVSCWNGIAVGRTTADEAYDILKSSNLVTNVRINADTRVILWNWKKYPDPLDLQEIIYDENNLVLPIDLYPTSNTLQLGDLISAYGDPTHVWTWKRCEPFTAYWTDIIYNNYGFSITPVGSESDIKPKFTANMYIYSIHFFR